MRQGPDRRTVRALEWRPEVHTVGSGVRRQARPKKGWDEDIISYLLSKGITQAWQQLAKLGDMWSALESESLSWGVVDGGHNAVA